MELEPDGDILVMTPTGNKTGLIKGRIAIILGVWAEEDGRGLTFDSSTGFRLSNGAVRSSDASWVANERWSALTEYEQDRFGVCPDFIIELASPSNHIADVRKKVSKEWIPNGVQLAWLIDVKQRTVSIYRAGEEPETLVDPSSVQGTGPVRGFELVMARVWD